MGSMDTTTTDTDHIAIAEACTAMGWWADRRQWDQLETLFSDEVLVDYTSLDGGDPARVSRGDLVAGWRDTLDSLAATQHLIAGPIVTVDGDTATCVANFQATHLATVRDDEARWTLGGHYRFALVRFDEGWRISELTMTAVWETGSREVMGAGEGSR
jgi:SnoaL-like domain